jgi:formylglycine-generating enzyme required for sulfatase activity
MHFVPVPETRVLFCIHETRRQDYATYAAEVPGLDSRWSKSVWHGVPSGSEPSHPVVEVTWDEAQAFCAWLGKKEGRSYRLPTDREWSYAVGIGPEEHRSRETTPEMLSGKVQNQYPWNGTYPPRTQDRAGNFADLTARTEFTDFPFPILEGFSDGYAATAPVMSFKPNRLGLYDMAGNVQQWCEDWISDAQKNRVVRGSGFQQSGRLDLQSSWRFSWPPSQRSGYIGFRCVVELPPP